MIYNHFIDIIFLFAGLLMLMKLRDNFFSYKSQFWPTIKGKVNYYDVQFREGGYPYSSAYVPLVEYEYSVNGKTYNSKRISFTSVASSSRKAAHTELLFLDINDTVVVYYNPNNPKVSVLKPSFGKADYKIDIIGVVALAASYILYKFLLLSG